MNSFVRKDILVKLLPYLPDSLLDLAITSVQELDSVWEWADAVVILAPRMAELGHHDEALDAVAQIDWEQGTSIGDAGCLRANALTRVARHLPIEESASVLSNAIVDALQISGQYVRSRALAEIASHLPDSSLELKNKALRSALDAARETSDSEKRTAALEALGPSLHEVLLGEALACAVLLPEGPYIGRSLRAGVLSELAGRLCDLPAVKLYKMWSSALQDLAKWVRPGLLWDIPAFAPVMISLGGQHTIIDAAQTIFDVANLWP